MRSSCRLHTIDSYFGSHIASASHDAEYGTNADGEKLELHLVAVNHRETDEKWFQDGQPTDFPIFLAYLAKHEQSTGPNKGEQWTSSPVLSECWRLWQRKTPLVMDLDYTLGCLPEDHFKIDDDDEKLIRLADLPSILNNPKYVTTGRLSSGGFNDEKYMTADQKASYSPDHLRCVTAPAPAP